MRKAIAVVLVLLGVLCCFAAGAEACTHKFNEDGMCTICGYQCPHDNYNALGWCNKCGYRCTHANMTTVIDSESTEYEWKSTTEHAVRTLQRTHQICSECGYQSEKKTSLKNETSESHLDNNNDGICDICQNKIQEEIKATFDRERMMLIISGNGAIQNYASADATPWASYRGLAKRILIEGNVTSIGDYAFAGFTNTELRIEFRQSKKPQISSTAFAGTTAVCRYYEQNATWTEGQEGSIIWRYLPYFSERDNIRTIYHDDGWCIEPWTEEGMCIIHVTGAQALEYAHEGMSISFETMPDAGELAKVIPNGNWDNVFSISFYDSNRGAECKGSITINLTANSKLDSIDLYADGVNLTVNDARENGLPGRLMVDFGTVTYNGHVHALTLQQSYKGEGHVAINGNVGELKYYDLTTDNAYRGDLTVSGTIATGTLFGQKTMLIPGVGDVTFRNMASKTFTNIQQEAEIIKDSELNLTADNLAKLVSTGDMSLDQFTIKYQFIGSWVYFELYSEEGGYTASINNIYDINPGFTTDDIIFGEDTEVFISALNDTEHPLIFNGKTNTDGTTKTGLKNIRMEPGCKVVINCPVELADIDHPVWSTGGVELQIKDRVDEFILHTDKGNGTKVTVGDGGSIQSGRWTHTLHGSRYFRDAKAGDVIFENSQMKVMNHKSGQSVLAILPSDETVTAAAGKNATVDLNEVGERELTDEEVLCLNQFLQSKGKGSIAAVLDISVTEVSVDEDGKSHAGGKISTLSNPVELKVSNATNSLAYIVRLHEDEEGKMGAEQLCNATENKTIEFSSKLFSKYVIVDDLGMLPVKQVGGPSECDWYTTVGPYMETGDGMYSNNDCMIYYAPDFNTTDIEWSLECLDGSDCFDIAEDEITKARIRMLPKANLTPGKSVYKIECTSDSTVYTKQVTINIIDDEPGTLKLQRADFTLATETSPCSIGEWSDVTGGVELEIRKFCALRLTGADGWPEHIEQSYFSEKYNPVYDNELIVMDKTQFLDAEGDAFFAYNEGVVVGLTAGVKTKTFLLEIEGTNLVYYKTIPFTILDGQEIDPDTLTKVITLPASVKRIEEYAFNGIDAEAIIVPAGCEYIGDRAFANCPNLVYVSYPESATLAGDPFAGSSVKTCNVYGVQQD